MLLQTDAGELSTLEDDSWEYASDSHRDLDFFTSIGVSVLAGGEALSSVAASTGVIKLFFILFVVCLGFVIFEDNSNH